MQKIILIFSLLLSMATTGWAGNESIIEFNELPQAAQSFIRQHYADVAVQYVKMRVEASLVMYEVNMKGGHEVQFNRKGEWSEVRAKKGNMPQGVVPQKIKEYVTRYYPARRIEKIEHNSRIYEVDLDNGVEITFNRSFKAISIN